MHLSSKKKKKKADSHETVIQNKNNNKNKHTLYSMLDSISSALGTQNLFFN